MNHAGENGRENSDMGGRSSAWVFGGMWVLLFFGTFLVAGPWAGFHGALLGCIGLLVLLRPPAVALPKLWWILAALFVILGCGAFLPASWFGMPEWRVKLEALGVDTGSLVAIQARQAAEAFALFVITLFIGLWLAGHRPSSSQLRVWALAFTVGVAIYAILSKLKYDPVNGIYGFFPNRNHTATYLAMGTICGLGNVLQALRDRRFLAMSIAVVATAVCLWAVAGWSISRGGVVLVSIGCVLWFSMLGRGYLGKHGWRTLALIALAGVGLFLIADTGVKERFSKTLQKAGRVIAPAEETLSDLSPAADCSSQDLDFRIPVALDALDLIRDFKWTGIGAGQFYYVFPQYRHRTVIANESDAYHPESDWLWMAAETGPAATLALATLLIVACWKSLRSILGGRDRALRGACLIAALLVPIHGIFDVPGHRITLALSAGLLFALSLRVSSTHASASTPSPWAFRLPALALLAVAGFLARAQWWGGHQPAIPAGHVAAAKVADLLAEDGRHRTAAETSGQGYAPSSANDPLEKALTVIDEASPVVPLQRNLYRLKGFVALHFDDKDEVAMRAFKIEQTLQPTMVSVPFQQARAWGEFDPAQAVILWREALDRSRRLDRLFPNSSGAEQATLQRILGEIRGKPPLETRWNQN